MTVTSLQTSCSYPHESSPNEDPADRYLQHSLYAMQVLICRPPIQHALTCTAQRANATDRHDHSTGVVSALHCRHRTSYLTVRAVTCCEKLLLHSFQFPSCGLPPMTGRPNCSSQMNEDSSEASDISTQDSSSAGESSLLKEGSSPPSKKAIS